MKAEAEHGMVRLKEISPRLTREEALDLMISLASAIQHSGDISDPRSVFLYNDVHKAVENFRVGSWA